MLCNRPTSQAKICHPIPKRSISIVNLQLTGTNVLKCKYVIGQQPTFDAAGQPLTAPVQELYSCLSSLFHFLSGNVFFSPDERLFDWEVKLLDWLVSTGHQDTKQEEVKCCSSWLSKTLLNSIIYHKIYYKNSVWGSSAAQRLNFRLGTWIVVWKQSNLKFEHKTCETLKSHVYMSVEKCKKNCRKSRRGRCQHLPLIKAKDGSFCRSKKNETVCIRTVKEPTTVIVRNKILWNNLSHVQPVLFYFDLFYFIFF